MVSEKQTQEIFTIMLYLYLILCNKPLNSCFCYLFIFDAFNKHFNNLHNTYNILHILNIIHTTHCIF